MNDSRKIGHRVRGRLLRDVEGGRTYALVLLGILITYFLFGAFKSVGLVHLLVVMVQGATLLFALRVSNASRRTYRLAIALWSVMLLVAGASIFWSLVEGAPHISEVNSGIARGASAVLYLITLVVVGGNLARRGHVDRETLMGAISMYLLLGMFFAFLIMSIDSLDRGHYFINSTCSAPVEAPELQGEPPSALPAPSAASGTIDTAPSASSSSCHLDVSEYLFFSFVTLTTTGYGNLVPATDLGQTLATFEAMSGTLFLILAIGRIVSLVDSEKEADQLQTLRQTIIDESHKEMETLHARLDAVGIPRDEVPPDDEHSKDDEHAKDDEA